MARTNNLENFLSDVASAIKTKKGYESTQKIQASAFDTEIGGISTVNNQNKTVTENGVVTPDTGYTGLGEVTVNVDSIPDGIFIQEETPTKTTTEAIWLEIDDPEAVLPFSEALPDEIWDTVVNNKTIRQVYNLLSSAQKTKLDACNYYCISVNQNFMSFGGFTDAIPYIYYDGNNEAHIAGNGDSVYFYTNTYVINDWSETGTSMHTIGQASRVIYSNKNVYNQAGTDIIVPAYTDDNNYLTINTGEVEYKVAVNKVNSWNKILDTSNADATAGDILTGKTAFVNNTKLTGTMPNNGTINITPGTTAQNIPAGYTSGGTVSGDANLVQANIKAGVTIFGIEGNLEPDKPDQDKTANPSISAQVIEPDIGYELASVTINPVTSSIDTNIIAENIKTNVTILGVTGTLQPGEMSHTDYITALELAENILGTGEYENTMSTLNSIDSSSDTYTGLGGTEDEIEEIFDEIIGEGENE